MALSRATNTQNSYFVLFEPLNKSLFVAFLFQIDYKTGLELLFAELNSKGSPSHWLSIRQNKNSIGVADVPFCSLGIILQRCFPKRIHRIDDAILGFPSFGTPSATGDF